MLEYENRAKRYKNEEIFEDNQMVYLLASHASVLQMNTTKFKQEFKSRNVSIFYYKSLSFGNFITMYK